MQLHEIQPKNRKDKKRIGRGGSRGTYSGKGMKGQKSRAGTGMEPIIRGYIKRYPKLRGFSVAPGKKPQIISLIQLDKFFKSKEKVTPEILVERGLVETESGKIPEVKILNKGEIKKSLEIEKCKVSLSAKEKIEKAGGKVLI